MNKVLSRINDSSEIHIVISNISWSLILKGLSLIISLINTRLYIIYYGNNSVLGAWYAIVTILNWIMYFDLGVGNGMRNKIVIPLENHEYERAKTILSTGYAVNLFISSAIIIFGSGIASVINWNSVLNLPSSIVEPTLLKKVIIISLAGVGVNFFLKTITSVYQALRKTAITGLTAFLTNISLCAFLFISKPNKGSNGLLSFSFAYVFASVLPFVLITCIAFSGSLKCIRPSIFKFNYSTAKSITTLGLSFFAIQIALLVISSTDSWLISFFFNPKNTVSYQVYYRFFSISLTVFALFSQTTWSSVTKYAGIGNNNAIKKIYRFLLLIACMGGLCCLVLAMFYKTVCKIWLNDVYTDISLLPALLFALWMTIQMFVNASTAIANGLGKLKVQAIFVPVAGLIKLILVVALSSLDYEWYIVVIADSLCLLPLLIVQHINVINLLKSMESVSLEGETNNV